MVTRSERIRLGFFILFGLFLLVTFLFLTAGRELLKKNDTYYIEYSESVSGLNPGNPVKRRGVEIILNNKQKKCFNCPAPCEAQINEYIAGTFPCPASKFAHTTPAQMTSPEKKISGGLKSSESW